MFLEIINVANKKRKMVRGFGGTIKSVSITYIGDLIRLSMVGILYIFLVIMVTVYGEIL